jgi:hypothetical protein
LELINDKLVLLNIETGNTMHLQGLLINCPSCGHENALMASMDHNSGKFHCEICDKLLVSYKPIRGFVYILSNEAMPGLLKIGYTTKDVDRRVSELSHATGIPEPFKIEAYFLTNDPRNHEKLIHDELSNYRHSNKEFFKIDFGQASKCMENIIKRRPYYLSEENTLFMKYKQEELQQNTEKLHGIYKIIKPTIICKSPNSRIIGEMQESQSINIVSIWRCDITPDDVWGQMENRNWIPLIRDGKKHATKI